MGSSWRTTSLGVLSILSAVIGAGQSYLSGHSVDFASVLAAVVAGIGLIKAADHSAVSTAVAPEPPKAA